MIRKKYIKAIIKILILILIIVLIIKTINITYSRFESIARINANVDIACYVFNKNFQTMNLNLDNLFPRSNPYVYTFSIANFNATNEAEVDLKYDLTIRTTTNLPLRYELYLNQNYDDHNAINIIQADEVIQDEDGTYFRNFTTNTVQFNYTARSINIYYLVVYFDEQYNTINYQDIIEGVEINIDSQQII